VMLVEKTWLYIGQRGLKRREYLAGENGREKNDGKKGRERRSGEKWRERLEGKNCREVVPTAWPSAHIVGSCADAVGTDRRRLPPVDAVVGGPSPAYVPTARRRAVGTDEACADG
jgi:hypothetical protein